MRIRSIKPDFFTDTSVIALSYEARLAFIGLWCCCDRAGRMVYRPQDLKLKLFPDQKVSMTSLVTELIEQGLVQLYDAAGQQLLQVTNFLKHQQPHIREKPSTLPAPVLVSPEPSVGPVLSTVLASGEPACLLSSVLGREGSKTQSGATDQPAVAVFPTAGKPSSWDLHQQQVDEFKRLYPGVDVDQEIRKALGWITTHPRRRKTARGMPGFLNSWLSRENDATRRHEATAKRDGAYVERPGDRPTPSPASEAYTTAYLQARSEGKSAEKATQIAQKAAEAVAAERYA